MANQEPNTFLSRIFGVNSQFPNDPENELSSLNSPGGSRLLTNSTPYRDSVVSNLIQSDEEDSDSNSEESVESDSDLLKPQTLGFSQIEEDDYDRDGEVPLSIMMHAVEQPEPHPVFKSNFNISNNNKLHESKSPSPTTVPASNKKKEKKVNFDEERRKRTRFGILNPKERALWKWANVENLDRFLQDVYDYYLGSGYYCILLSRVFDLATLSFVVYFSTYLTNCIDYSKLKLSTTKSLNDIKIDQCFTNSSFLTKFSLWLFYIFFFLKLIQLYFDSKNLTEIHDFYKYLLEIDDQDLQTISWNIVVQRIMNLKDQNAITSNVSDKKSKTRIDAHIIANRIMRKENYFIAMFNREIFDLTLPIPFFGDNILTKTLEWNLQLCITGFVFNESGQIRQQFLKENKRNELSDELRKRFILAGILNIILAPLLVIYFILLYFFRYFNEYKKNPGSIGSRQYTLFAEWKFREFNELYHIFQKRLNLSVPYASKYVDQFPKEKTVVVLKFISFISGSFAAVLGILAIVDPDMFFNFEITKDKTVLFYISIFGTIWAICHNAIPEEYQVYDPEYSLKKIAELTHYLPQRWDGKYHTEEVRSEFCEFFAMKLLILIGEIASLVLTPFILWFSLPNSCDRIVDFFRDYSVHIDGLGYVCTFAMFNFEKAKNHRNSKSRGTYYQSDDDKMMKSYLYFLESYGDDEETKKNGGNVQHQFQPKRPTPLSQSMYKKLSPKPLTRGRPTTAGQGPGDWNSSSYNIDALAQTRSNLDGIREQYRGPVDEPLGESFLMTLPKTDINNYKDDEDGVKKPGVLGMVNQFYKDYQISH